MAVGRENLNFMWLLKVWLIQRFQIAIAKQKKKKGEKPRKKIKRRKERRHCGRGLPLL